MMVKVDKGYINFIDTGNYISVGGIVDKEIVSQLFRDRATFQNWVSSNYNVKLIYDREERTWEIC